MPGTVQPAAAFITSLFPVLLIKRLITEQQAFSLISVSHWAGSLLTPPDLFHTVEVNVTGARRWITTLLLYCSSPKSGAICKLIVHFALIIFTISGENNAHSSLGQSHENQLIS